MTAPASSGLVRGLLVALGLLLVGYMFLGRGFAHIGAGPIYIGDVVMVAGIVVASIAIVRWRLRPDLGWTVGLLLAFVLLGAVRTLPYLGTYGMDSLRDGVLWGYAAFAVIVYVLVDRWSLLAGFRAYGWVVPVFALWLPISWNLFRMFSLEIDPSRPGSTVPLVFFKSGDMAVHVVGAIAFLIVGAMGVHSTRTFVWRTIVFLPLVWTIFVAGTSNRGSLITAALGIMAVSALSWRARNWRPFVTAIAIAAAAIAIQGLFVAVATWLPADRDSTGAGGPSSSQATHHASASQGAAPEHTTGATTSPAPVEGERVRLINGDFELGVDAAGAPKGWMPRGAEVTLVAEGGYEGSTFASMRNGHNPYEATLTSSQFAFEGGNDLSVAAWVTATGGRPTLEIYVNWYDQSGALISNTFVKALATYGDSAWREFGGVVTAPPKTTHAEINLYEAAGKAALGIDAITVTSGDFIPEKAATSPDQGDRATLTNSGFELGLDNTGAPEGWQPSGAEVSLVHEGAHRGTTFVSLENRLNQYEATLTSDPFVFEGGDDIYVSAWVKAIRSRPTLEIYVNWYRSSGLPISSDFSSRFSTEGRRAWQEQGGMISAPDGATRAEIRLFEATGHATIGVDDLTIRVGDFTLEPEPPPDPPGRPATIGQLVENIVSLFGDAPDPGLEGTKQFRLAWWGTIIDYTVFGDYFWTGKGFGVNLADDDGFQSTADGSLRAPHNSHMTVLARMGVPGLVLWLALQVAFSVGLLRSTLSSRRDGQAVVAAMGAWLLVYWVAMMVDTSFDPYLEGPQGGIWFWAVFGAGLVVMRLSSESSTT